MKRFASETQVGGGYYLNTTSWSIEAVEGERGTLPGAPGTESIRLATPVMVVAAMALSLGFVIFLPAIAIGLFAWVLGKGAVKGAEGLMARATETLAPQYVPGEATLVRPEEKPAATPTAQTEQLTAEVAARADAEKKNAQG